MSTHIFHQIWVSRLPASREGLNDLCKATVSRHIHMSRLADENVRANYGACFKITGKNVRYGVPLHMYASPVIGERETLKIRKSGYQTIRR